MNFTIGELAKSKIPRLRNYVINTNKLIDEILSCHNGTLLYCDTINELLIKALYNEDKIKYAFFGANKLKYLFYNEEINKTLMLVEKCIKNHKKEDINLIHNQINNIESFIKNNIPIRKFIYAGKSILYLALAIERFYSSDDKFILDDYLDNYVRQTIEYIVMAFSASDADWVGALSSNPVIVQQYNEIFDYGRKLLKEQ